MTQPVSAAAPTSERVTVKRKRERGRYEPETVEAILDEALICQVAFVVDGQPYVLPTIHGRIGKRLYLHGAPANRMLGAVRSGAPLCVSATVIDALVFGRSAFHHSMNYRSVVVLAKGAPVEDDEEKCAALEAMIERVSPGRWAETRPPTASELRATLVVSIPLDEASAKVRTGPPIDEEEDYDLPFWAGELPVRIVAGEPLPDDRLHAAAALTPTITAWTDPAARR